MINIKGIDKAEILAALYNNARPLGMGFLQYVPGIMTAEEAQVELDENPSRNKYFDYLAGRVMKVDLSKNELRTDLYDRDNGPGAAYDAIKHLLEEKA